MVDSLPSKLQKTSVIILALTFTFSVILLEANAQVLPGTTYGGTKDDSFESIVQSSDGGYALAGQTYSFGAGNRDMYLVKTDSTGDLQWSKTFGGVGDEFASSIVKNSDGGYTLAGFTNSYGVGATIYGLGEGDMYLVRTDSNGNLLWNKTFGGRNPEYAYALILTNDGGYLIAGQTFSFGIGGDIYLVKTDSNGNLQWSKNYGEGALECAYSVIATSDGGYAVAGYRDLPQNRVDYFIKINSNGNLQWSKIYTGIGSVTGKDIIQTSDNGYALTGTVAVSDDLYLVKTDSSGDLQWSRSYGGAGSCGNSILVSNDGAIVITGYVSAGGKGERDVYLLKINLNGDLQWSKVFGAAQTEQGSCIIRTTSGGYAIAGYAESLETGLFSTGLDGYLLFTDSSGSVQTFTPTPTPVPTYQPPPTYTPNPTSTPTTTTTPTTSTSPTEPTPTPTQTSTNAPTTTDPQNPTSTPTQTIIPTPTQTQTLAPISPLPTTTIIPTPFAVYDPTPSPSLSAFPMETIYVITGVVIVLVIVVSVVMLKKKSHAT